MFIRSFFLTGFVRKREAVLLSNCSAPGMDGHVGVLSISFHRLGGERARVSSDEVFFRPEKLASLDFTNIGSCVRHEQRQKNIPSELSVN